MNYKKITAYLFLTLGVLMVTACASNVRTKINTFIAPSAPIGAGSIKVMPIDDALKGSLEFAFYQEKLEQKLKQTGYRIDNTNPDYIAQLGFSVSQKEVGSTRYGRVIYGSHFGFSHFYNRGGLIFAQEIEDNFEFERLVKLVIVKSSDANSNTNSNAAKTDNTPTNLLEITARSLGRCESLTKVFAPMLDGVFQNLTRPNGSVVTVKTAAEAGC